MKKLNKTQIELLARRAAHALEQLEVAKEYYKQLDLITDEVIKLKVDLKAFGILVVDNFADKNTVFRPAAVRRFELKKVG